MILPITISQILLITMGFAIIWFVVQMLDML